LYHRLWNESPSPIMEGARLEFTGGKFFREVQRRGESSGVGVDQNNFRGSPGFGGHYMATFD